MKRVIQGLLIAFLLSTHWGNAYTQEGNFLTLPFSETLTLTQGWRYNVAINPGVDPYKHEGIDWSCPEGTPILAVADGLAVQWTQYDTTGKYGYGIFVLIKHPNGYYSLYAHLKKGADHIVKKATSTDSSTWTPVSRGEIIGFSGMTGTTVPHLHFEVRKEGIPVNPLSHLIKDY